MAADLWTTITIFVGVLGVAGIASFFIPGVATYVSTAFQTFIQILRQGVQFVIDGLPKPLKILLFIGLFAMLGVWTYNLTYGAPLVCDGDQVTDVGYFKGIAIKLLPTEDPFVDENNSTNTAIDAEALSPRPTTEILQANYSALISKEYNVDWFGKYYETVFVLHPRTDQRFTKASQQFFEMDDADIWANWFGGDKVVQYNVCYDSLTDTCILERKGVVLECAGAVVTSLANKYPWDVSLGTIHYFINTQGSLEARFSASLWNEFNLFRPSFVPTVNDCGIVDSTLIESITSGDDIVVAGKQIALSDFERNQYRTYLQGQFGYLIVPVEDTAWINQEYDLTLYDVTYDAIAKNEMTNDTVTTSFRTDLSGPNAQGNVADTRRCTGAENDDCSVYQLVEGGVVQNYGQSFKVVCDTSTEDPFDTKPLILGVDILNWKTMALFVLLGALLSFYMWVKRL